MRKYKDLKYHDWVKINIGQFKGQIGEIIRFGNMNNLPSLVIELLNIKNNVVISRGNVIEIMEFQVTPYPKNDIKIKTCKVERSMMKR